MEPRLTGQPWYVNGWEKKSDNALQLGVKSDSLNTVKTLLKHGANAVYVETETVHPLILASGQGSVATVKELLDAGAPINVSGKKRSSFMENIRAKDASPMHSAVANGSLDLIKLLLSHGADLEKNIEESGTPLSVAASEGRADIVRLLLSAGANATDGAALYAAVREGSIEIAQELLAAGSKAEPVLALACRRGLLPMIEILLEKIYDGERPEIIIDEVFAIHGLGDSVFRLLLDYARPTMKQFIQVCAAGSAPLVQNMLGRGGIDINGQFETNGDYPLQVVALHLQAEVVRFLLTSGAIVNCKSAKHGTPLMTSLEACAISVLRRLESEKTKDLIDRLNLPDSMRYYQFRTSGPGSFEHGSAWEQVVQLLLSHGADIVNENRPFGSPMHLVCLLGSKRLIDLLLGKGADFSATAGFFEKTIFAAIQGGNPDVVDLVLQKAPLTKHMHPEYGTPLHLACANNFGAAVRKLLEHGADATVLDAEGRSPLTIALEMKRKGGMRVDHCYTEAPLDIMMNLANPLHVLNEDLVRAAELNDKDAENTLAFLLDIDQDMIVPETVMCNVLKCSHVGNGIIQLLMQRNGGIGVTAAMLKAVRTHYNLEELLEHRPICRITPEILKFQRERECMKLLLDIAPKTTVTEEVIFRAVEIGHASAGTEVLETLLERRSDVIVSQEMLQAARCGADMKILLNHLSPDTCISSDVIASMENWGPSQSLAANETMRSLLQFDPSIRLDHDTILKMIRPPFEVDTLEIFLEHDPSMLVSEEIFLRAFEERWKPHREKLVGFMHKYGNRLVLTETVRRVIDEAYQDKKMKTRLYNLSFPTYLRKLMLN
ncbi:MAG: hypothetical protein Q9191_007547 [Dirinaria sp. TL-2023a]